MDSSISHCLFNLLGYQTGQTNAERVVNITWGEDIQPVVNGKYIVINRMRAKRWKFFCRPQPVELPFASAPTKPPPTSNGT
jgi:hypothetical protein